MLDWTKTLSDAAVAPQALSSEATGILIGTRIATNFGWRNVEALCLGDMVLTFDHGFRSIVGLRRVVLWDGRGTCPEFLLPLKIKRGLLENAQPKHVLPMQGVMVESDAAEDYRGMGPVLVGASRLAAANSLRWEVGTIFGLDDRSADYVFRLLLEYEFY